MSKLLQKQEANSFASYEQSGNCFEFPISASNVSQLGLVHDLHLVWVAMVGHS